jgi:DNA ligase-1
MKPHPIIKPMLATKCEAPDKLRFPLLATPKLDGIRCLKINGRAVSRKFLPIPNAFTREWLESSLIDGLDGELMVEGRTFNEGAGDIARHEGWPDFRFHVFDYVELSLRTPYEERIAMLKDLRLPDRCVKVIPNRIDTPDALSAYEEFCIAAGYEGVMVRTPDSPYKCGRSTEREGWLLKIKRFEDEEAEVLDTYERMSNQNEAQKDAFGRTKRSTSKAGKVGLNELGGFVLRRLSNGEQFDLGYNHVRGGVSAAELWKKRKHLKGRLVKFSHQPSGAKEGPRFPTFLGFREKWDM